MSFEETSGEKIAIIHPHKLGTTQKQQNVALMPLLVNSSKVKAHASATIVNEPIPVEYLLLVANL